MDLFDILTLVCGLSLFLYGMHVMGSALKRSAGNRLKGILFRMTSNPVKGFFLGLAATAVMQSSSATTVMVVGFINSGAMTLSQSIGVILGANMGAAITFWLTGLSGLGASGGLVRFASPDAWMPILAIVGVGMLTFSKRNKKVDLAHILLGFSVLMVGMNLMSGSVGGLKDDPSFRQVLVMFDNPLMGLLTGTLLTAAVQSSGASVGILQSMTTTGVITYGLAIPIILGQNIGTCVTALLSSVGATKDGKRAALAHLYFNVLSGLLFLAVYWISSAAWDIPLYARPIDMWGVAGVHTAVKAVSVTLFFPLSKQLAKLAAVSVSDKKGEEQKTVLDERLFATPTLAVESAARLTRAMAQLAHDSLFDAIDMLSAYDPKRAEEIRKSESEVDRMEDTLGTYLVNLSSVNTSSSDSHEVTMLLHTIGDLERISDHSVNIVESAEELREKHLTFSDEAQRELRVLIAATREILDLSCRAFVERDLEMARRVEPLEQTIDELRDRIKLNHVRRLQKNECSIEHGFVLNDLLTNFERVADHCSNIAGCLLEMSQNDALDLHRYLSEVKTEGEDFERMFNEYRQKYSI
ncbi:MAG: Na/Pi cotransporter family protein [Clostridia bacterium]|nr:Na/Pi cotransporter family protein [Clostridia bacterium]